MNLMFLNSLEKKTEEERVTTAQVSICENHGVWHVFWSEPGQDGKTVQHSWYEGLQWKDMLEAYREGVRAKREEGFFPLIDESPEVLALYRSRKLLMLQFYGERHHNPELFQKLREWRWEQSVKEGKAAFIVATNRVLHMISAFLPHQLNELIQIPGMGKQKANLYGESILELTKTYERQTSFPLDWVEQQVIPAEFEEWLSELKREKENQEQERRLLRSKLLDSIGNGSSLNDLAEQFTRKRSDILLAVEQLDKDGYDVEALVESELQDVPPEETDRISGLFQSIGDRYLKPVLHQLYNEEERKTKDLQRAYEVLRLLRIRYRHDKQSGQPVPEEQAAAL